MWGERKRRKRKSIRDKIGGKEMGEKKGRRRRQGERRQGCWKKNV